MNPSHSLRKMNKLFLRNGGDKNDQKNKNYTLIIFLGFSYNNYAKEETNQIKKKERIFFVYLGFNLINSAQAKWVADDGSGRQI